MSYIARHLMPGETVEQETQVHWFIYWPAIVILVISAVVVALFGIGPRPDKLRQETYAAASCGLLCVLAFLMIFIRRRSSEFAVTNKRVVLKVGLVRRQSTEILLRQVEGITVDQGLIGRIFDYGTIIVEGTGSDRTPYRKIARPLKFRLAVQEQIDKAISPPSAATSLPTSAPAAGVATLTRPSCD